MLATARFWLPVGLLALAVQESRGGAIDNRHAGHKYVVGYQDTSITTTITNTIYHTSTSTSTVVTTTTVPTLATVSTTATVTTPTTTILPTTTTVPSTVTVSTTATVTTPTTTTLPTTLTVPTTITVFATTTIYTTITLTSTTPTTTTVLETTTIPTTTTLTQTFTTFPIRTSYTTLTVYDPCPSLCSISAGTVNVIYWPTDKPHSYPATYYDPTRRYTFTSPSVYMLINTMVGTNSQGRIGPEASSTIWAFDLDEVSTLVLPEQTETRQLSLSDLGTRCPQTLDATAFATKIPNSRCDPVLAAPSRIRSWAFPCNACGPFGLFDPPYAIPTLPGGLLGTTTIVPPPTTPAATTPVPEPTVAPAPAPVTPIVTPTVVPVTPTITPTISRVSPNATTPAVVVTAAGSRLTAGIMCLIPSLIVLVLL